MIVGLFTQSGMNGIITVAIRVKELQTTIYGTFLEAQSHSHNYHHGITLMRISVILLDAMPRDEPFMGSRERLME